MFTLDHLVIAARTLDEGVDWCEATLGVRPTAGGQHRFMGTHNRIFDVSSDAFPRSYAEIIAIDSSLPAPAHARWFDLDDAWMQRQLVRAPQLVHWVARVDDIEAARIAMLGRGVDGGEVMNAERGALRWRITVRADGRRMLGGAMPALIQWDGPHPTDALAASGVRLESISAAGEPLAAVLAGLNGRITLQSPSSPKA